MSVPKTIQKFLQKHKVNFEILFHPGTVTSLETAELEHVSGKKLAKVVMVKKDGQDAMFVLPASHTLDLLKLSVFFGTRDVRIEEEKEFASLFPDCETGALPPFGKLYKVACFVDKSLKNEDEVVFNAGTHQHSIKVSADDFFRILKAEVGDFAVPGKKIAA